jgi:hypothetical protein
VSTTQLQSWNLATASPALLASSLPLSGYVASSASAANDDADISPGAEWALEAIPARAINDLRRVVAGVSYALIIEGAVALFVYATWNLWHLG